MGKQGEHSRKHLKVTHFTVLANSYKKMELLIAKHETMNYSL